MTPALNSALFIGGMAIVGLWVGALLARLVHALPLALEAAWQAQMAETNADDAAHPRANIQADDAALPAGAPPSLLAPLPCEACGAALTGWRHWLALSAVAAPSRCPTCSAPLPGYRRLIQWLTAMVLGACAWHFGATVHLVFAVVFCAVLIALAFIDARTTLLPDILTLPLLWMGLLVNSGLGWAPLSHAVWGAAMGYGGLWLVYHAFRLMTGRDGMGYGDFKLLAALGAWLGVALLPWILLAASLAGVVVGITLRMLGRAQAGQPLPFGPYLSAAGIIALLGVAPFPGT